MSDGDAGVSVWNGVLAAVLKLPGVKVDRTAFLKDALASHLLPDVLAMAIQTTPAKAGVPNEVVRKAARASIRWHRSGVTALSTLAGLPGGWWLAGSIPADLTQYFWHVVVVLQKLAYLYGWPELLEEDGKIDDETRLVLTLFIGVMLGAQGAAEGLKGLANALSKQVVKRLPQAALTKHALYRIAKEVAKWLGVSLTKKKFGEWAGRAIPIVGGIVAGGVTWLAFGAATRRLAAYLESLPLAHAQQAPDAYGDATGADEALS